MVLFVGIIVEKKVILGSLVMFNDVIFMLVDLLIVWIEVSLNEILLVQVQVGVKVCVMFDVYLGEVFIGQVIYVFSLLDKDLCIVQVCIEVVNKDGCFKLEMFVSVSIDSSVLGKGECFCEVISVFDNVIVLLQGQFMVFVVFGKGFDFCVILLGDKVVGRIIVKLGLSVGESVVVEGVYVLKV